MAITATITGPLSLPNLSTNDEAYVYFTLSKWDKQSGEHVFLSLPSKTPLDVNGDFSVDLHVNAAGDQDTYYIVEVSHKNNLTNVFEKTSVGMITIEAAGTFLLADLNILPYSAIQASSADEVCNYLIKIQTIVDRLSLDPETRMNFSTVNALLNDNLMTYTSGNPFSVAEGDYVTAGSHVFRYVIENSAALDYDFETPSGIKVSHVGDKGVFYPAALIANPLIVGLGVTVEDCHHAIQRCLSKGPAVDLMNYSYRSEATNHIHKTRVLKSSGAQIFYPTTGSYLGFMKQGISYDDYLVLDETGKQEAELSYFMKVAFNMSSSSPVAFEGPFIIRTDFFNGFHYTERTKVRDDLSAVGGLTGPIVEWDMGTQFYCEGWADWMHIPAASITGNTRQAPRLKGTVRSRHNLSPMGYSAGSTNGFDDSEYSIRSDRCGGLGRRKFTLLANQTVNMLGCFWTGLTDKTKFSDEEPTQVTFTANSQTVVIDGEFPYFDLSLQNDLVTLANPDFIMIPDAYERGSDNKPIPLVAMVIDAVVANGQTTVTLAPETMPTLSGTGKWFFNPPRVTLGINSKWDVISGYIEGFIDCVELQHGAEINWYGNAKGGGRRLSGRHQALFNTTGLDSTVKLDPENTIYISDGIESVIAFGMLRSNIGSGTNSAIGGRISVPKRNFGYTTVTFDSLSFDVPTLMQ